MPEYATSAAFAKTPLNTDITSLNPVTAGTIDNAVVGANAPAGINITSLNGGQLAGHRNLLHNGDFRLDLHNAYGSITPINGQYSADRWLSSLTAASKFSTQVVASTTPGSAYSLKVTSASAYSPGSTDVFYVGQVMEGFDVGHLQWGTAFAVSVTVSGILNCSIAGTYSFFLGNNLSTRQYYTSVPVPVANVDTPFSFVVPGDTSGTWARTALGGLFLGLAFGFGSSISGTSPNVWSGSAGVVAVTGSVNLISTSGATLILKDVQMEAGTVATPFERINITAAKTIANRYFQQYMNVSGGEFQIQGYNTTNGYLMQSFALPTMRAVPTCAFVNIGSWSQSNATGGFNLVSGSDSGAQFYTQIITSGDAYLAASSIGTGVNFSADF